jgi:hypothetical protein
MSVINCIVRPDAVVLATDGAGWDADDGTILSFGAKAATVPHWPGVIACRGPAVATPLFAFLLGAAFRDWDAMVGGIEDRIEDIHDKLIEALGPGGDMVDIVLAGWSAARAKGEAFLLRTTDQVPGMSPDELREAVANGGFLPEPYKLCALPRRAYGPNVTGLGNVDTDAMGEGELLDYLRGIMEWQRRDLHCPDGGGEAFSICGGFAVATVIDAGGVRQTVFHRWDGDRVGERINVEAAPIDASEPVKLSRLKAEMADRRARKLARG